MCGFKTKLQLFASVLFWSIFSLCVCFRLAEERIAREIAESRLHMLEDQLAELQEELRRVSENSSHSDSMQTVRTLHSYACTNKLTIAPT